MTILFFAAVITVILLVWFKSEMVTEYGRLLGLKHILKIREFEFAKFENIHLSYPIFLKTKWPNFFFKLIGCRLCLSIWLSGISSIFISSGFLSFVSNASVLTLLSLFMFGTIAKYLNEN